MKVFIMVGVPGSGKSTIAKEISKKYNAKILSSDKIREKLFGSEDCQENGYLVFSTLYCMARESLEKGENIIIDATNINRKARKEVFSKLKEFNFEKIAVVKEVPIEVAKKRNKSRDRVVPDEVIENFYARYEKPTKEEFDEIIISCT